MSLDLNNLKMQLAANPRQAAILGVLVLVMVAAGARAVFVLSPRQASAVMPAPVAASAVIDKASVEEAESRIRESALLWKTLREVRGVSSAAAFQFDGAYYVAETKAAPAAPVVVEPTAEEIAARLAESETQRRDRIMRDLQELALRSTSLGPKPMALINTRIVHVGDQINGFLVVSIQARGVQLKKEGMTFTVEMPTDRLR